MPNLNFFTRNNNKDSIQNNELLRSLVDAFSSYEQSWHLDKKVPIVFICALLFQTGSFIWWAATAEGRLTTIEKVVVQKDWAARMEVEVRELKLDLAEEKKVSANQSDLNHLQAIVSKGISDSEEQTQIVSNKIDVLSTKIDTFLFNKAFPRRR